MYRTHNCGELRIEHKGNEVTISGWVQKARDLGGMTFVDLRDRYGISQLVFNMETNARLCEEARKLGREFVIQAKGKVAERSNKNPKMPTGDIEIEVSELNVINQAKTPPFTIEDETDGGEELRMKYRYLDLRRNPVKEAIMLRHQVTKVAKNYLDKLDFVEVETPFLIKSTPEGARDFVVPSRMNDGQFYALPQSPQTLKQLLMVAGFDRYYQFVKCFRDEDLRADRQPEFSQLDCEMAFVEQEDILQTFEGLAKYLLKEINGIEHPDFERIPYAVAMEKYGSDKPDIRFCMEFCGLNDVLQHKDFKVFNSAELVVGIVAEHCAVYTRKQLDALIDYVKRPQVGATGLVYIKCNEDGSYKSSVDKFYDQNDLKAVAEKMNAKASDLILIMAGETAKTQNALGVLRLHLGNELGLRKANEYKFCWITEFPLMEFDEEEQRHVALHHMFTKPIDEDVHLLDSDPTKVRAEAYDLVLNGNEVAGGSVRIHKHGLQDKIFDLLGFSKEEAKAQFGFLLEAFEFGAPPHAGIAFGFDRFVALFGGSETIRDYIAFPKNNSGRDVMLDAPAALENAQLEELGLVKPK